MGLLEIASGNSLWRGYDYYEDNMVESYQQTDQYQYEGTVQGSKDNLYNVVIDVEHPKRSTCTCPHAEGTRRVCKHKVALYFSVFPDEAVRIVKEAEEWEKKEAERWDQRCKDIEKYVKSMSKQQLQEQLLWRLIEEEERRYYGWRAY